jgi:hypothetical protein
MQPETRFKNKVLPLLREIPDSWWVKIQQRVIRATPDIIGTVGGVFVAWELKTDCGEPTALQLHRLDQINASGGWGRVIMPSNLNQELQHLYNLPKILLKRP